MKTITMNAARTTRAAIASRIAAFAMIWVAILGLLTQDDDRTVNSPAIMKAFRSVSDISSTLPVPFWGCIIGCAALTMLLVAWRRNGNEASAQESLLSSEEPQLAA